MPQKITETNLKISFSRALGTFGNSLWGACLGVAFSAVIALLALHLQAPLRGLPSGFLPENTVYGSELPEKIFFLSSFLLGSVGAFIATIKLFGGAHRSLSLTFWFLGFVFSVSQWMRYANGGGEWLLWLFGSVVWLMLPLLTGEPRSPKDQTPEIGRSEKPRGLQKASNPSGLFVPRELHFDIMCVAVLALMIFPSSIADVAARVGFDAHPVSFIVGPALFFWGDGLIPGKDFFTQYGVGQGFFFSFFLGNNAQETVENFIRLMVVLTWAFYGISYLVLRSLFGSRLWALLTVVFMVILNFHLDRTFIDPSSWPIRYPFLFITVWLIARGISSEHDRRNYPALGVCCGLSFFWNTETGIYSLITACFVIAALSGFRTRKPWLQIFNVVAASIATFLGLSWLAYGVGVFSAAYLLGLIEPLLIFSSGYAAVPVNWAPGWGYFYNLIGPILSIATIGWALAQTRVNLQNQTQESLSAILSIAVFSLLFLFKWVNMSLDAVWHMNAYPIIIVASWWLRQWFLETTADKTLAVKASITLLILSFPVLFLIVVNDPRNRTSYAGKAFWIYPSLLKRVIVKPHHFEWPAAQSVISREDIALIIKLSGPRERVAIIHPTDWAYLIQARRPPRFHFLPSTSTFLGKHLERSLADAPYIFIKRSLLQEDMIKSHSDHIRPLLSDHYAPYHQGEDLMVFKRKD